jgi:hypothetical protein
LTSKANNISVEAREKGYPRLAAFIDSDVDYNMFRGFGSLHALLLLHKQAELTELEGQLQELDKADANNPETKWKLHSHINTPKGDNETRKALLEKIELKMKEYGLCFSSLMKDIVRANLLR